MFAVEARIWFFHETRGIKVSKSTASTAEVGGARVLASLRPARGRTSSLTLLGE
jgi:hypothetical protein